MLVRTFIPEPWLELGFRTSGRRVPWFANTTLELHLRDRWVNSGA